MTLERRVPLPADASVHPGGAWLLVSPDPESVFTPERMTEEHRMIQRTARAFVRNEVLPVLERLEQKDWALARRLLKRCGDLGLLGVDVPEEFGGVGLDKVASLVVSDELSRSASFGATLGGQANLTVMPLFLFGTEQQKEKYLPRLLTGELVGAYALSESGSGSDALGARTHAERRTDGSFVLNGEKMWITNGGFADVFIVFAKVGGDQFSAFIVERAFGGLRSGKEEHKMGLNGSSTTAIVLENVPVPAGNLLGEVGKGHKVAFNVLNFGRVKLGAACSGAAKGAIDEAVRYAAARRQFGRAICTFGAIRHKLGEMIARAYSIEAMMFRTAGLIDGHIAAAPREAAGGAAALAALEEYAMEASIAKIAGSEALDFVLDENIQIHGGNGYVRDYPAERHFRDARVNRIFEGTNEINRLLIGGMLARRAMKGDIGLIPAALALRDELAAPAAIAVPDTGLLAAEAQSVAALKKVAIMVFGLAMQTCGQSLQDEQEILMHAADILIDVYTAESAVLRARAAAGDRVPNAPLHADTARLFVNDAVMRVEVSARQALAAMTDGDTLRTTLAGLRRLLKALPINTVVLRRHIADEAVTRGGYPFQ
jgi:alkylation response protein AidB-like acyl-CoA dehydrogenase